MEQKKIPILNEKIDPFVLWYVLKKSILLSIVIFIVSLSVAFIYLRYTPPIYKATSVIQVKNESENKQTIFDLINKKEEVNLNQTIELLRSPEFLKRTINKLPLDVSYFAQGTFLAFELYNSSPFKVEYVISNTKFYRLPIYVSFVDNLAILKYNFGESQQEKKIKINEWNEFDGIKLKLNVLDSITIRKQTEKIKTDSYFFIINDSNYIQQVISNLLEIYILNPEANTIQISFTDQNATKASDIVKTIAEEFINFDIEKKIKSSKNIIKFIDEQIKVIYLIIDSLEEQLVLFRNTHKLSMSTYDGKINPNTQYEQVVARLQQEIEDIDIELIGYNKLISKLESNPDIQTFELISLIPNTDQLAMSIINKIQLLDDQKEQILSGKTTNSFQIKILNKQIEKQKNGLINILKANLQRLTEKRNILNDKLNSYKKEEFGNISLSDLDYLKLKRMYDINIGYYNKLLDKKAEYMITQAGSVSQNIILQSATIPSIPISPSKKTVILIALLIALFISGVFVVFRYLMYNEITSADDIQRYTEAKVLGIIPLYKSKLPVSQLLIDIKPNSIFSESFRSCRSSIEFMQNEKKQNIISVSSTVSGEGKTLIAINLAGIFALQNKKVILIDMDLRRPRIHIAFNTDNSKGVSTILTGKNKIGDCIKKSKLQFLDYITAGPIPPNPSELISSSHFNDFLNAISAEYDYVIIDTPPVGLVSDALTIYKLSHFPIYVVKLYFSKRSFLYNVNHLIDDKKIKNLTILINAFDFEKTKYSSQYNYSYYGYSYNTYSQNRYYEDIPIKKKSIVKRLTKILGV